MAPGSGTVPAGASQRVLRPRSATIAVIASAVVALVLLGDALVRAGIVEMLRLTPWVLLALWGIYVLVYSSHIAFDARGVTVQNYLRVTRLSWQAVADVSLRWQVVFALVGGGTVTAYGGPVVGRPGRAPRRDDDRAGRREADAGRPGASSGASSSAVPAALREFGELRDAWLRVEPTRSETGSASPRIERSWDIRALLALLVIVLGAIVSVLTTGA